MQSWFFLAGAIALEVAGTTSMKLSQGFTKLFPSVKTTLARTDCRVARHG